MSLASLAQRIARALLTSPGRFSRILTRLENSKAHAELCQRVYGRNLCQFNAAPMEQLENLIHTAALREGDTVVDLGCGNGVVTEYVASQTGAHVLGLDFAKGAIRQATIRTKDSDTHVRFETVNLGALDLPEFSVDVFIAIDSLYSFDYLEDVIERAAKALKPGGRFVVLYTDMEARPVGETQLGKAFATNDLTFNSCDLTGSDTVFWPALRDSLHELRPRFLAEHNKALYWVRELEARKMAALSEQGKLRRYLYVCTKEQ